MKNVDDVTHCLLCKTLGEKVQLKGYVFSCVCPKCGYKWNTIATKKAGALA